MAKPESQGSSGGKISLRRMPLRKANSIGFSVLLMPGSWERTKAHKIKARAKSNSVVSTRRQFSRSQRSRGSESSPSIRRSPSRPSQAASEATSIQAKRMPPALLRRKPALHPIQKT